MKNLIIAALLFITIIEGNFAQNLNWRALNPEQPNMVYLNIGYDFGMTTQIGYSRSLKAFKPISLLADYSFPMGENVFDDLKIRLGGQIELYEINGFSVSTKLLANIRRHETDLVRMAGFGTELSLVAGYYKPGWFVAGEFGLDKSIITNLEHSDIMKEKYPEIKDGWYIPSGGNYFYGIQAGKSLGNTMELSLRFGFTDAQGKDEDSLLPYYGQIGLIKKF